MKNNKALKIEDVYKTRKSFNEISLVGDLIFWKEMVEINGKKNNSIFARPIEQKNLKPQKLIGDDFLIKSNFHGYGGSSYQCIKTRTKIYLVWIDQLTRSLWVQEYRINSSTYNEYNPYYLENNNSPRQLSKSFDGNFDANFALINENTLIGILESNNNDFLYSISINKEKQELKIIKKFDNFAGSLSSNLGGNFISWIEWGEPFMPWENNDLFFADINDEGMIKKIEKLDKSIISSCSKSSIFQPYWLSENLLVCSEDSSGWWNLIFLEINTLINISVSKRIVKKFFEYGLPQWVSGISLFSGSKEKFFCLARHKDYWILEYYQNLSFVKRIELPFTNLSDLHGDSNKLIFKGSSNIFKKDLVELDINNTYQVRSKKNLFNTSNSFSKAETYWFKGFKNRNTHALIYKSKLSDFKRPPLMVKAHSGPTSYFDGEINPEIEFWTSKGWFVAEVNYGGSSGFGKDYRNRLNKNWGIVDSEDCKAVAKSLIQKGLVDESRIVIFGNSAGGFTALNSLCNEKLFKAAICKYPVIDLKEMHFNTHRFEKYYLNSLVGDFDSNKDIYYERSPINKIDQISQPVLIFHGKEDPVVDYSISLKFHKKLLSKNIYSEIYLYDDEGHGIKDMKNQVNYLLNTELFLNKIFFTN